MWVRVKTGSEVEALLAVSSVVFGCRRWGLWRSRTNPPKPLAVPYPSSCSAKNIRTRRVDLSFHLHIWRRWDTQSEEPSIYNRPRSFLSFITLSVSRTQTSIAPHPAAGPWLAAPHELNERRKSPKRPQPRPAHCYYPAQVFFASFFCPIKTRRGLENNNYQEGDVCNYSIARQAGSEVSKGCAVVPTSKLSLLPLSLQLSLIGEGWKKRRRKIKVFGVWRVLLNWWCAKTTLPACLWTLLLFPPKSHTQSSTTESSSKRINRISPSAAVWTGHTNKTSYIHNAQADMEKHQLGIKPNVCENSEASRQGQISLISEVGNPQALRGIGLNYGWG